METRKDRAPGIFISYRREDTEGYAGRLFEYLATQFGRNSVFMDVVAIEPGRDFRRVIDQQVGSCAALLVVIGKDWTSIKNEAGARRLDDPRDFVRLETTAALQRDIPVIPVLVEGARMPRAEELPEELRDLAYRNCVELTHARWHSDVQLLAIALRPYLSAAPTADPVDAIISKPVKRSPRALVMASAAGAAVIAVGYFAYVNFASRPDEVARKPDSTEKTSSPVDRVDSDKALTAVSAGEKAGGEKAVVARAVDDKAVAEKVAAEKAAAEKAAAEKAAAEKAAAEKAAAEKVAAEKAAAEKAAAERIAAEKAATEKAAAARAAAEKAAAGRAAAERAAAEKAAAERATAERAAAEMAAADKVAAKKGVPTAPPELRSIDSNVETHVTFINRRAERIRIYWIDYGGKEVLYAELPPGGTHNQATFVTHPWVIRSAATGTRLRTVVANNSPMTAAIEP